MTETQTQQERLTALRDSIRVAALMDNDYDAVEDLSAEIDAVEDILAELEASEEEEVACDDCRIDTADDPQ